MKLKIYLIGTLALLSQVGCSDYLDEMPISSETNDNAYDEATQIEAALNGTYESFQTTDFYVWDNVLLQDVRSDNHYAGGDNAEIYSFEQLTITPTNSRINKAWSNIYNAILKANTVLEKAPLVADPRLTEERRKQIIGEAKFLRAYHYYNLVTMWGGVPIVLVPTKSASPSETQYPRASVEAVYDQILSDLNNAIAALPDTYGDDASINKARATAGAAHALAAKAYMQMPTQKPALALEHIAAVEASKAKYKLINYSELFDGNHFNNDESIIEVQFISGGQDGNWAPQMHLPPSLSGDSWRKFVTPSHDLINAYDAEGDVVRKNATVMFEKVSWVDEFWFNTSNAAIPFAYKWKNASGWKSADREYILRYGDIVLLKAEALNEAGDINGAAAEVNKIRLRAQLPELTPEQKSSKAVLKNTILKERRLELAQEAQRWTDLVRFGVAVSTMQNLVEIDLRSGNPVVYPMTAAKILLPIPQTEIDRNPLVTQNPL